jgi:hypothetical protein
MHDSHRSASNIRAEYKSGDEDNGFSIQTYVVHHSEENLPMRPDFQPTGVFND